MPRSFAVTPSPFQTIYAQTASIFNVLSSAAWRHHNISKRKEQIEKSQHFWACCATRSHTFVFSAFKKIWRTLTSSSRNSSLFLETPVNTSPDAFFEQQVLLYTRIKNHEEVSKVKMTPDAPSSRYLIFIIHSETIYYSSLRTPWNSCFHVLRYVVSVLVPKLLTTITTIFRNYRNFWYELLLIKLRLRF